MEPVASAESGGNQPIDLRISSVSQDPATGGSITPQQGSGSCPTCSAAAQNPEMATSARPTCVYVIGQIEPRYPSLGVEKEFRQAAGARVGGAGHTDREVMAKVLKDKGNKYLVRQLCWVLTIQGIEQYILVPRDGDYQQLVDAYRTDPKPGDLELIIGTRGPVAPPSLCNGLLVPMLAFDQIYAFDRKALLDSIPKPRGKDPDLFAKAAAEALDLMLEQSDSPGTSPADIARTYLAMRYPRVYELAAEQITNNASLTSIHVVPSTLGGHRRVVDVVFSFTDRATDVVSKYFARVDVSECFPFLVSKLAPYYDR
jgi:hypothetical protein